MAGFFGKFYVYLDTGTLVLEKEYRAEGESWSQHKGTVEIKLTSEQARKLSTKFPHLVTEEVPIGMHPVNERSTKGKQG